jgi:hypothetical protein
MSTIFTQGRFSAEDAAGAPLVGGLLHTYSSGTTTPRATYSDPGLTAANTNPISLNARGEAQVWLGSGAYSMRLTDAAGVTIWTVDGITPSSASAETLAAALQTDSNGSGADLVAGTIRVVTSIADLRTVGSAGRNLVLVAGYYSAGDGGGGIYRLDAGDTTSADNGGTVIVGASNARWKLVHNGTTSVKQFGAKGDGVANDFGAIQAAIDATNTGTIFFPRGRYYSGSVISVNKGGITLLGAGNAGQAAVTGSAVSEIITGATVGIRFGDPAEATGYGSHIYPGGAIENLAVTGSVSTTSGIRAYNITIHIRGCFISNVMGSGGVGIWLKSAWCSTIERTIVQGNANMDVYLGDATNSIKLDSLTCLSNASSIGVYIVGGTNTITLINCDFEGKQHGVYVNTASASVENLSLIGTNAEGCVSGGISVVGGQKVNGLQIRGYRGGDAGSGINLNYHSGLNIDGVMLSDCSLNFGQIGQDGAVGSVVLLGAAAISGHHSSIRRLRRTEAFYAEYAGAGTVNPGFDADLYNTVQINVTGGATSVAVAASGGAKRGVGDQISVLVINAGLASAGGAVSMPTGWKTSGPLAIPPPYKALRVGFERDPNGQWWEVSRLINIG